MTLMPVVEGEAFQHMEEIIKRHLKGHSDLKIARDLQIKMVEVSKNVEMWREIARQDMDSRDSARDHLNEMVARYENLIETLNENLETLQAINLDDEKSKNSKFEAISAQINTTVRNIADLDAKRVDLLQKAGLLGGGELADELAERERREEVLIGILRNDLCPDCKMVVARKLQALTNEVEVVQTFE